MSDFIPIDETKAKSFFTVRDHLEEEHEKSIMDSGRIFSASNEIHQIIKSDLGAIEDRFDRLFHEFECFYPNDFYTIVENAYSDIIKNL